MPPQRQITASSFSADAFDFIRLLEKHGVRYVVAGGEAVIYHGYPRYTGDIDFFYESSEPNSVQLFEALSEFWNGPIPEVPNAQELRVPRQIIQFGRPPHRIDLLNYIDGVEFSEAWNTRESIEILGTDSPVTVHYLSKAALMKNKRASGRPRDMDDVEQLEALE